MTTGSGTMHPPSDQHSTHIGQRVRIGRNCTIGACSIGHDSHIGDSVMIECGAIIGPHVTIESACFIGRDAKIEQGAHLHAKVTVAPGAVVKAQSNIAFGSHIPSND